MLSKIKDKIGILLILLLGLLSLTWFKGNNLISGGDFNFSLDWIRFFKACLNAWEDTYSFGSYRMIMAYLPVALFGASLQFLGFSVVLIEKILFYLWFAGGGISMYFLCSAFGMKRLGRTAASIFYMLNPFSLVIIWRVSHGSIQIPYAFAPLLLGFFVKGINEKRGFGYICFSSFLLFLCTSAAYVNPRSVLMHFIPVFFYLIYLFVFDREKRVRALKFSFLFFGLLFLFNFYWIFQFFTNVKNALDPHLPVLMTDAEELKLTSVGIIDSVRMLGYWSLSSGYKGEPYYPYWRYYTLPLIKLISWLIPLFVILGLLAPEMKKKKLFYYFLAVILFGLWGIKGPLPPLGGIIVWLYKHIPYSVLAARFNFLLYGLPTYLIFSVVVGFGFNCLWEWLNKKNKVFGSAAVGFIFILLTVVLVFPFWNGEVIRSGNGNYPGERFKIPSYWYETKNWLNNSKDYFRVWALPMGKTYNTSMFWGEGYSGTDPIGWLTNKPVIWCNSQSTYRMAQLAAELIERKSNFKDMAKLMGFLNTRYLLLREDTRWDFMRGHGWQYAHTPENVKEFIDQQPGLPMEKQFGLYKFYGIKPTLVLPEIYLPRKLTLVFGEAEGMAEIIEFLNPEDRDGVAFGDQNEKIETLIDKANQLFVWKKPVARQANDDIKQAVYELKIPQDGEYELYFPNDGFFGNYQFEKRQLTLSFDEKETITVPVEEYGNNLLRAGKKFLAKGQHRIKIFFPEPTNLIENPSFESGLWSLVGNAQASLSLDSHSGKYSLDLKSGQNAVIAYTPISNFRVGDDYWISFATKHVRGNSPTLAVWENDTRSSSLFLQPRINSFGTADPFTGFSLIKASVDTSWKNYQFSFRPKEYTQAAGLAFIGDQSQGGQTENLYDNIKIERVFNRPLVLRLALGNSLPAIPEVKYQKVAPTRYRVELKGVRGPFLLVLSQAFDQNWLASLSKEHFVFNGFANGWYIDQKGDIMLDIYFGPQKYLLIGCLVSLSVMILLAIFLGFRLFLPKKLEVRNCQ